MIRCCDNCGQPYEAVRSTSRFCSTACRCKANRKALKCVSSESSSSRFDISIRQVGDTAYLAHKIASDFSRQSIYGPVILRKKCERIGIGIESLLKSEGL